MKKQNHVRAAVCEIVHRFEKTQPRLDELVSEAYRKHDLNARERKFLKNVTSGVVRHRLYLDWMARRLYRGNYHKLRLKVRSIIYAALYEIIFTSFIPPHASVDEYVEIAKKRAGVQQSKVINGMLRNYLRNPSKFNPGAEIADPEERLSIIHSYPRWLIKRWITFWGAEATEDLCRALNQPPTFELVINTDKLTVEQFQKKLATHNIEFQPSGYFSDMVKISDVQAVRELGWFEKGLCRLQDESAHIPVKTLNIKPTETVLDVCAAPGGKFMQMVEQIAGHGKAIAMDIDVKRLQKTRQNLMKTGRKAFYVAADGRCLPFKPVFDKILLDAPCSGLGVIQKHPDIKWRRSIHQIVEFSQLQSQLLATAESVLKPGGRLTYATCTIDPMENEQVVEKFLANRTTSFKLIEPPEALQHFQMDLFIKTAPDKHQTDGSFTAVMRKTSGHKESS